VNNDEEIREDIDKILGRRDATVPSLVSDIVICGELYVHREKCRG